MIRYIGAAFIALAGVWVGFAASAGLSRRVMALEECCLALRLVCAQIMNVQTPLPLAMHAAGGRFETAALYLRSGAKTAVDMAFESSALSAEDRRALTSQLDLMMRMSHAQSQGVCEMAQKAMAFRHEDAVSKKEKNAKLYRALGVCGGCAAAILLL